MCFSAQCWAAFREYEREFGAGLSIDDFARLYGYERIKKPIKKPKALKATEAAFASPTTDMARAVKAMIDEFNAIDARALEQELFKQKKRLADAERTLQTKATKKAAEDQRIATGKVSNILRKIDDLKRTDLKDRDSRFFPGNYVPVMVAEGDRYVLKPMRYGCRPAGKPADYDFKYPGTYNARRDNLERFWKGQFGYAHGIIAVNRFYENVSLHASQGRNLLPQEVEQNVVLEFNPRPAHDMFIACLWSRWTAPGEDDLLSFAMITDEPPPEVAAAGHDRCIIPIKRENVDAWLHPDPANLAALQAILDDRDRPFYEHRLAA